MSSGTWQGVRAAKSAENSGIGKSECIFRSIYPGPIFVGGRTTQHSHEAPSTSLTQIAEAHAHDLENPIRSKSPVPLPGMCRKLGPDPLEEVHTLQLGSPGHPQPDCNGMSGWDPVGREDVNGYVYLSNYSLCLSLNYLSIYRSICA